MTSLGDEKDMEASGPRSDRGLYKRRGVEPVTATLRAVAQAVGVPFPTLAGRKLPMDLMLKACEFLTARNLIPLRESHSAIELKFVRLPAVMLGNRHVHALQRQYGDLTRHMELWRHHVLQLILDGHAITHLPEFLRAFSVPSFGSLHTLTLSPDKLSVPITPLTWRMILNNCPKLATLYARVEPSAESPMTEEAWLAPLRAHEAAWKHFSLQGIIAPPSVYLIVANSKLEELETSAGQRPPSLPLWTVEQVQKLIERIGERKEEDEEPRVVLASNVRPQDSDAIAKIFMDGCPNLSSAPWLTKNSFRFSGDTIRRMYATWKFMTFVPPPFHYHAPENKEDDTRFVQTRMPLRKLFVRAEQTFFRRWTMDDLERILLSSDKWEYVDIGSLHPVPDQPLFIPSIDSKVVLHVLRGGARLTRMLIRFPCAIREEHLQAALSCPSLRIVDLGQVGNANAARFQARDVQLQTVQELLRHLLRNALLDKSHASLVIRGCVITNLSVDDWTILIRWWHDVLKRPTKIDFEVYLPIALADELQEAITQHDWDHALATRDELSEICRLYLTEKVPTV